MKNKTLLPLALAMVLAPSVFAANLGSNDATSTMTITVDPYINITKTANNETATITEVGTNYSYLKYTNALFAKFHVATNTDDDQIALTGTTGPEDTPSLYGTADAPVIVFANTTHEPTVAAIADAGANTTATNNANAIAFTVTPRIDKTANSGAADPKSKTLNNGVITYTLQNGDYDFTYTLNTKADKTVSTLDQDGMYTSKIVMSHVTP